MTAEDEIYYDMDDAQMDFDKNIIDVLELLMEDST